MLAVVIGATYALGHKHGSEAVYAEWIEANEERAKQAVPIIVRQGEVTVKEVVKWRTKVVKVKGDTEYITKEIIKYVPASADVVLPHGWVHVHDAAAAGALPEAPEGIDVAAPGVAASTALKGVVENYGTCHEIRAALVSLQTWVAYQYVTSNQGPLLYENE